MFNDSDITLIQNSRLFDAQFYKERTGFVDYSTKELVASYLKNWGTTGIEPSLFFDGKHYQETYRAHINGMVPLLHFLKHGIHEGLNPWSEKTVLSWQEPFLNNPELAMKELNKSDKNWPKLEQSDEVHIHVHSNSHIVFHEFQHMLVTAFKQLGIDAKAVNETIHDNSRLRIIIAPHDYFCLEPKVDINTFSLSECILFNTEQITSVWFGRCYQLLYRAAGVVDINLQTAVCLSNLGVTTHFLPLGRVNGYPLFQENLPLPTEISYISNSPHLSDISQSKDPRPIDLVWIGSKAKRRQAFLDFAQPTFDAFKCFIRLVNVRGALSADHPGAISALGYAALGQKTKILLNIHHFGIPYFEWQRLMHFGFMQGACVVTETVSRIPHLVPGEHYIETDLQHIPELVEWLLQDKQGRETLETVRVKGYQKALQSFELSRTLKEIFIL